jgi:hypothetical protein
MHDTGLVEACAVCCVYRCPFHGTPATRGAELGRARKRGTHRGRGNRAEPTAAGTEQEVTGGREDNRRAGGWRMAGHGVDEHRIKFGEVGTSVRGTGAPRRERGPGQHVAAQRGPATPTGAHNGPQAVNYGKQHWMEVSRGSMGGCRTWRTGATGRTRGAKHQRVRKCRRCSNLVALQHRTFMLTEQPRRRQLDLLNSMNPSRVDVAAR